MAAICRINLSAPLIPAVPEGTGNAASYGLPMETVIGATTDTLVMLEMAPADYAGGGTDPNMRWELAGGSSPMDGIVSAGTWTKKVLVNNVNGETQDWTKVRFLSIRAMPLNPAAAAAANGVVILGDLTAASHHRICVPFSFDSADTDSTPESGALVAIPGGHTWSLSYPLKAIIYSCSNLRLLAALLGN